MDDTLFVFVNYFLKHCCSYDIKISTREYGCVFTDEEEFGEPNELEIGFTEPNSVL